MWYASKLKCIVHKGRPIFIVLAARVSADFFFYLHEIKNKLPEVIFVGFFVVLFCLLVDKLKPEL